MPAGERRDPCSSSTTRHWNIAPASSIALNDAGARHRLHRVDFASEEQKGAAYTALNPKGRVPALVSPQGALTETPAIRSLIARRHPEGGPAPADPFAFAGLQEFDCCLPAANGGSSFSSA
jgi:glutathione S-transferase